MSSMNIKTKITTDFGAANKKLGEFVSKHGNNIRQMVTNTRRTAQILISLSAVGGGAIDQTLAMGIEAGLLTLELVATAATAESVASLGITAIFQYAAIVSLINAIFAAKAGRQDISRGFAAMNATFRMISY